MRQPAAKLVQQQRQREIEPQRQKAPQREILPQGGRRGPEIER
jgi:hypothetical protein